MNDFSTVPVKHEVFPTRLAWRSAAADALSGAGYSEVAADLLTCGDKTRPGAVVFCDNCGYAKAITYTCHSRLCAECERRAQVDRMEKYLPIVTASHQRKHYGYNLKHVTITTDIHLTDSDVAAAVGSAWRIGRAAIDEVLFAKLKRYGLLSTEEQRRGRTNWKAQYVGALAGGEFGEGGQRFHMHFLMYSPFLDKKKLSAALKRLSGGRWSITWVNPVDDAEAGAREVVLKYATKLSALPVALLPALQAAITGQRRVRCYGAWFGVPDTDEQECGCPECGNKLRHDQIKSQVEWDALQKYGVDAWFTWVYGAKFSLDLRPGNKSGDSARGTPHWNTPRLL